ncbi:lipopolysaccharide heptosyltransferase family protein [bacterium]|nr:lipopolysaccharide heptosyltransferase family protein [bacterium]
MGEKAVDRARFHVTRLITAPGTSLALGCMLSSRSYRDTYRNLPRADLMKSIAVIRLDEIGDVALTGPFLRELRRSAPGAWISLIVKPGVENLVEHCPHVNEVLTCPGEGFQVRGFLKALGFSLGTLRKRRFDLAVIPRWDSDIYNASFLAFYSNARWRIGFSEKVNPVKQRINRNYDLLLTHTIDSRETVHEVLRSLEILPLLGATAMDTSLEAWTTADDDALARAFLEKFSVDPRGRIIALGPFSREPKRAWPAERYLDLAEWMVREYRISVLVVGGREDGRHEDAFRQRLGSSLIFSAGPATLRQTVSLLRHCCLYIGNDSGPMHLAASAGLPVIEISAHPKDGDPNHANSPLRFGPWKVPRIVLNPESAVRPCTDCCSAERSHCIESIGLDAVKDAAAQMLQMREGRGHA